MDVAVSVVVAVVAVVDADAASDILEESSKYPWDFHKPSFHCAQISTLTVSPLVVITCHLEYLVERNDGLIVAQTESLMVRRSRSHTIATARYCSSYRDLLFDCLSYYCCSSC